MLKINPQFLVDDKGEKTAALLTIKEFQLLMQRLKDLEDISDMDAAVETDTETKQNLWNMPRHNFASYVPRAV